MLTYYFIRSKYLSLSYNQDLKTQSIIQTIKDDQLLTVFHIIILFNLRCFITIFIILRYNVRIRIKYLFCQLRLFSF